MEEHVGQLWHRLISRVAQSNYPEAVVTLEEIRLHAGIVFRALGGDGGLRVEACTETAHGARRTLAQRIAGNGQHIELAWRDEETLRLPMRLSCFNSRALNRDLYLWLAALAAVSPVASAQNGSLHNWLPRNAMASYELIQRYPGMASRYERLLEAHWEQRPDPRTLQTAEGVWEHQIQCALRTPDKVFTPSGKMPSTRRSPMPVPLWLHPLPPLMTAVPARARDDSPEQSDDEGAGTPTESLKADKRRRGERVDTPEGRDGLLAFRLESLFSRAEYVAVDRSTEDNEDEDARDALEDLDLLSMASGGDRPKSRLRFDLDLPSEAHDDTPLGDGILLPEWDFHSQLLRPDQCRVQPLIDDAAEPEVLPASLLAQAQRMRQVFELMHSRSVWHRGQPDGSEIDTDAFITSACDRRLGKGNGELRVFRQLRRRERDLSCLLLADLSLSTDTWIDNSQRVIDVIRDSLLLFSETLAVTQDQFALYGFSSRRREHVRFHTLKQFDEDYSPTIVGRIRHIKPGYYTRMGAAIRYATQLLEQAPTTQKLLLLLTDGKPNDLDCYEGRYGIEDTRQAVRETSRAGITPFCVTIDDQAQHYLPYIFGQRSFARVSNISQLPSRLPMLYATLTH